KTGRTAEQVAVFEKLKAQYPRQLIDFPIDPKDLPGGKFPKDKIGATYFMHYPNGEVIEMTNLGVQIKEAHDGATWGVWQHKRSDPRPEVTKRVYEIVQFLEQANIREVIGIYQGKDADKIISFLDSYSSFNQGRPS